MKSVIELIERNLKTLEMRLDDDSWRKSLPSSPGWYFIETNAPPNILKKVGQPKGERHYNIPEKVNVSLSLKKFGACILPSKKSFYFVYSGETKNLKARAREHVSGHSKTGCLALINYPVLHKYEWKFYFSNCTLGKISNNKLLRIFGEQIWRSKKGWPILCGK